MMKATTTAAATICLLSIATAQPVPEPTSMGGDIQQLPQLPLATVVQQQQQPQQLPTLADAATPSISASSTGSSSYGITFKNSCAQNIKLKYKAGNEAPQTDIPLVAPGATYFWDATTRPTSALDFIAYYSAASSTDATFTCPDCVSWGQALKSATSSAQYGAIWSSNPQAAAYCNPALAIQLLDRSCCAPGVPGYDPVTNDCTGINDMGWGTQVEFTFAGANGFTSDSMDISTNYVDPANGYVFFNIPVSITVPDATQAANCNHSVQGVKQSVPFPWVCGSADCTTAYQSPTDSQLNGSQLQCSTPQTNYVVEYCPSTSTSTTSSTM